MQNLRLPIFRARQAIYRAREGGNSDMQLLQIECLHADRSGGAPLSIAAKDLE